MADPRTRGLTVTTRLGLSILALCIILCACFSSGASAQTTHKYIETWSGTPGATVEVQGVDPQGNVYVFNRDDNTVEKFNYQGEPVNFSALGTNRIDGEGGPNCPAVPADCDRVPVGHITGPSFGENHVVAVDSSDGPAAGYIYVNNPDGGINPESDTGLGGVTEIFAPSGKFLGELNKRIPYPSQSVDEFGINISTVTVDGNGHVYVDYCCASNHADQYAPIDANPAHDVFIGQLRRPGFCCGQILGGKTYSYIDNQGWEQATQSAWQVQTQFTPVIRAGDELWGDNGDDPQNNDSFRDISIDPRNEDVYLVRPGFVEQWDKDSTHQIGPQFGSESAGRAIGFDVSGGPHDGNLYIAAGANQVAVYSGPVLIPDVTYEAPTPGHFSGTVRAEIGLDSGPAVEECMVQYGKEIFEYSTQPAYELGSVPCSPATPYAADTKVSAVLSGLETETDYHYRVVVKNSNGTTFGKDQILHTVAVVSASTEPATEITKTTATLNGKLDPDGMVTEYHFEYGVTANYETETPTMTIGPAAGVTSVIPAAITGLQPGRTYHYALVATNSLGKTVANDRTFAAARSPRISGVRTTNVTETEADLHARVNPFGYSTKYHFEYGETPEYGTSVPIPEPDIGSGTTPQEVIAHLTELVPGVVYHFRVVATNEWGTSIGDDTTFSFFPPDCPNSHVRQVTGANYLPDCRAYELVSPDGAAGVQLFPGTMTQDFGRSFLLNTPNSPYRISSTNTGQASNPARLAFWGSFGALPGTDPPNSLIDMYVATRSVTGWNTVYPGIPGSVAPAAGRPTCDLAMVHCIDYSVPGPFNFAGLEPHNAPYVWLTSGNSVGAGRLPTNLGAIPGGEDFIGDQKISGDFKHYVFSSRDLAFAANGLTVAPGSMYDNDLGSKALTIVSKQANGQDIEQDGGRPEEFLKVAALSTDGSHILMSTDSTVGATNLYMRVDDAVTYEFAHGVRLIGMTRDGSRVIFVSNNRLTADDTDSSADIYSWSEEGGGVLTRVSKGNNEGDSDDCHTNWEAKCGARMLTPQRKDTDSLFAAVSGDVMFYSPENLDEDNPGIHNQRNLYQWHEGETQLVTTLDPGTEVTRVQISPDGNHSAFVTNSQVTGYDNHGFREMYTYDADTEALSCASCFPNGEPPTDNVEASGGGLFMSDDGRTFFSTTDALVPTDTNGGVTDVYEYVDGRPQLITAGTGLTDLYAGGIFYPPHRTGLEGVSADGVDVYFSTFDTLVPQDHNGLFLKFYDARTNGGFEFDPGLLPCVAADECHEEGSPTPPALHVGSGADLGEPGHGSTGPKAKKKKKRAQRRKRHRKHAKHKAHGRRQEAQHHG